MNRLRMLTGLLAAAVVLVGASVQAKYGGDFDIGEFMKKANAPKNSYRTKMAKMVKDMDWGEATKMSKEWFDHAQKFTKATPPKGDKAAFEKLATNYCKTVKGLTEACEKKEADKDKVGQR